jgi:hypothetical protein
MSKPMIRIVELDGTVIDRELTDAELAQHQLDIEKGEARKAEAQAKTQAKAVLLERLGLTQEEFNTLTA